MMSYLVTIVTAITKLASKCVQRPPPPHLTPLYVQGLSEVPDQFVSVIRR